MNEKKLDEDRQNFVSPLLGLPLFMLSRNRLREDKLDDIRKQVKLAGRHYSTSCQAGNRSEEFNAATFKHYRHVTGSDKTPDCAYPEQRPLKLDRSLSSWRSYHQAPNRYGILKEPYESRKGSHGARFAKIHTNKSCINIKPPPFRFYDMKSAIDTLTSPENRHKGMFLSNARERRPSTRFMLTDPTGCWRDPTEPGPADTHTDIYEIEANMVPYTETDPPNPHLFLRLSAVPTKPNELIKKNTGFEPGPGRYEVRYPNVCPCDRGKEYRPGLQLEIEKQKRLKFRRQVYTRINARKYCDPESKHIIGNGHRHLFKMGKHDLPPLQTKKVSPLKGKKTEKQLKMFADSKYMNMLIFPKRNPISLRDVPVAPYQPKIVYNCVAKRVIRKQHRINKKVAFLSGQHRWKDGVMPRQLTQDQLDELIAKLPPERRLQDHGIELRESKVSGKLLQLPDRMIIPYTPKLRKRNFKFLPIPGARVLVTENDIRPDMHFDRDNPEGFYYTKIDERKFYRDSFVKDMGRQMDQLQAERLGGKLMMEPMTSNLGPLQSYSKQSIGSNLSRMSRSASRATFTDPRTRATKTVAAAEVAAFAAAEVAAEVSNAART